MAAPTDAEMRAAMHAISHQVPFHLDVLQNDLCAGGAMTRNSQSSPEHMSAARSELD
jgi:hypothetical protein